MLHLLEPMHVLNVIYLEILLLKIIFTEKVSFTTFLYLCRKKYYRGSKLGLRQDLMPRQQKTSSDMVGKLRRKIRKILLDKKPKDRSWKARGKAQDKTTQKSLLVGINLEIFYLCT